MNKFRMLPPLLGLAFLLAGCGDSRPAETVRLVTYNAGTFNKYIADDYPLVAEMMREVGADAVCLNELDSCTTRTGGVFQLERGGGAGSGGKRADGKEKNRAPRGGVADARAKRGEGGHFRRERL